MKDKPKDGDIRWKLSFAWLPCKTERGWAWLVPIVIVQEYGLSWQLVPEVKPYQVYKWKSILKTTFI